MKRVRLGLIGDSIAASQAPRLHTLAGAIRGIAVRYDLLVPAEFGLGFDALFDRCAGGRYRGINVTHSYKERAAARVEIENPLVRAMGAVNLVRFESDRRQGFNTDYTGFLRAWRVKFGTDAPGVVCQVGAGGAGRASCSSRRAPGQRSRTSYGTRATRTPHDVGGAPVVRVTPGGVARHRRTVHRSCFVDAPSRVDTPIRMNPITVRVNIERRATIRSGHSGEPE